MGQFCRAKLRLVVAALAVAIGSAVPPLHAQSTGTVRGTVTDASNQRPLAGAQVVAGERRTVTDQTGRYTLSSLPAGTAAVRAEMIGYGAQTRSVTVTAGGEVVADFALSSSAVALEGLVVTALGITREERSISTSVQQVTGDELTRAPETNLVTALSGRVSGVSITNANTAGGSARIVIRGANSLTGNNQPLFVVDGTPVSNSAGSGVSGSMGYNAIDYGNAIQDINPNDIASITVLKGPNAAALYGSRAANGAILITTKSGRSSRGMGISAASSVTFETPLLLPGYQNVWGQGNNGQYSYKDGRGNGTYDDMDESWGPPLDVGLMIPQFFSNGQPAPWVSSPDNVRDFFETGRTVNTSASFATSGERSNVRISVANIQQDGMYPGFQLDRTTVGLNGGANLTDRLNVNASFQYIDTDGENRPAQGYGGDNFMWQFLWFGRQVDTKLLRERQYNDDGTQFNWNNAWNNNPYWIASVNGNQDSRDRIVGTGSITYQVTPWLSAMLRSGTDWYQENRRQHFAAGTIGISSVDANGAFGQFAAFRQETNSDFLLSADFGRRGDFSANANFGGNRRDNDYRSNGAYVRNLVVPGLYDLGNAAVTPAFSDWREQQRVNSLYGAAQVGFRDVLFVDVTGRNDWSSTLPEGNNSYFYPSISSSLVFSDLVNVPGLSFGKVWAGWAQVGNDASPYQLVDPYIGDTPFNGVPRYTASNRLRNFDLKPEQTESWEVGAEMGFLGDRLRVEGTYYDKVTSNQIIPIQITPLTGFTERMLNAGRISNRGVEMMVDAIPVRLDNGLEWNLVANFSKNNSRVEDLYGDLDNIVLGSYYGVTVEARKGQPYGQMYGRKYVRDSKGNVVVGTNGLPVNTSANPVGLLGSYEPDWSGGLTNTLRFRGAELSVLIDTRQGGSIYSLTNFYGRRAGVLSESLPGRRRLSDSECANYPQTVRINDACFENGLVVDGVMVNAQGDTVPNTRWVTARNYHRGFGSGSTSLTEEFVYDASFVKLRELRLGYDLPRSLTDRLRVERLSVAVVGRNLMLWSDVPNIDPETAFNAGNVQGFEYSQLPSARSIGFNVSVTP